MAIGLVDSVGLGTNTRSIIHHPSSSSLSLRSAVATVQRLLTSPQFRDGVRLFAVGAAVSASKVVFDAILTALKRIFIGEAIFRGRDEAYRWILLLMVTQPSFRSSPRAVEVSSRPTLLVDYEADYRGALNEDEVRATWTGVQGEESDEMERSRPDTTQLQSQDDSKSAGLGVHFFPTVGESVTFTFEGVRFWASRQRELVGDDSWDETIKLSYLSLSSTPLRKIIKAAREMYHQSSRGRVTVHRLDRYGNWTEAAGIAKRSVDSIHLPTNIKTRLLEDAKNFLSPDTRSWYSDRGIPYRRGYLLYGTPGSGKSSLCHVLASETNRPIYALNLAASSMNDETFLERMSQVPGGALLLIEDVDAAFVDRSSSQEARTSKQSGISFSTLLNALDGVGAVEGRLLCMTTNHIERLDPALIRPGRVDLRFEFTHASRDQAKALFIRWYLPRTVDGEASFDKLNIHGEAEEFSRQIPPHLVSVAAIQGFLLAYGNDHASALDNVGAWIREQQQQSGQSHNGT